MAANGQLVFTDVDKVTFKGVGNASNAVIDTTTGKIGVGVDSPDANLHVLGNCFVSTNFELGGTMTMGTVTVRAQHELSAITATGNTTPHTIEFTNAETGIVTTGNVGIGTTSPDATLHVSGNAYVSSNLEVGTANLFVDTVNSRVGVGTVSPQYKLDVGNGGGDVMLRVMDQTASSGKLIFGRSGNTEIRSHAIESYNSSGSQNNYMKFLVHDGTGTSPYETRTEVMTLLGNGNVGIGTTTPGAELHIAGTGAIVVPSGTTAQKPTGVTGMIRFNTGVGKLEFYNGTEWSFLGGVSATGGTITTVDGYTIHTFTTGGSFTVVSGGEVEYLVVAGGGGGGADRGGGGGAGGMLTGSLAVTPGSYTITIGSGGAGALADNVTASNGNDSSALGIISSGGGGGGSEGTTGANGGSGGGASYSRTAGGGTTGQGNDGANGVSNPRRTGGGGGAGAAATNQNGGVGLQSSISGTSTYYAGGGGGGGYFNDGHGGSGGSGIVIIRYLN